MFKFLKGNYAKAWLNQYWPPSFENADILGLWSLPPFSFELVIVDHHLEHIARSMGHP